MLFFYNKQTNKILIKDLEMESKRAVKAYLTQMEAKAMWPWRQWLCDAITGKPATANTWKRQCTGSAPEFSEWAWCIQLSLQPWKLHNLHWKFFDFRLPELWENQCVLKLCFKRVFECHSSHRKLIKMAQWSVGHTGTGRVGDGMNTNIQQLFLTEGSKALQHH